jgi:hypothetical protein
LPAAREVATMLGGRMYDCVCKFDAGAAVAAGAANGH